MRFPHLARVTGMSGIASVVSLAVLLCLSGLTAAVLRGHQVAAQDGCTAEQEPNDLGDQAVTLEAGPLCATGSLPPGDVQDVWLWSVGPDQAAQYWSISVQGAANTVTRLQLLPVTSEPGAVPLEWTAPLAEIDTPIDATSPWVVPYVLIPEGHYALLVARSDSSGGTPVTDTDYTLRIEATGPPPSDFEREPNGTPETATRLDAGTTMHGRLAPNDVDSYSIHVEGPPELWQVTVNGTSLSSLEWLQADGTSVGSGTVAPDGSSATLTDLYLLPGDHTIQVAGAGGDYTITSTSLGPPDPAGELEPNGDELHAERLDVGVERNGRLPSTRDVDVYRFSLAAPEHLALTIAPPPDGVIAWSLEQEEYTVAEGGPGSAGVADRYDVLLPPGDYLLQLSPTQVSDGHYRVGLERLDPFSLAVDQEPNDTDDRARRVPPDGAITGTARVPYEHDRYLLGPLADGAVLEVRADGGVSGISVSDGVDSYPLVADDGSNVYRGEALPTDVPLVLDVQATDDYQVRLVGAGWPAGPPAPGPLPVTMSLSVDPAPVAAYWTSGQRVGGALALTNAVPDPVDLELDALTSHYAWTVALDPATVHLDPGATVTVPVSIVVAPDAWADVPVRATVRARDAQGRARTTFVELTPDRDAPPVGPEQAWTVPDELLGGLDAASLALGAAPLGTLDPSMEASLHDGVTPVDGGMRLSVSDFPASFDVDLAGEEPVPVAGTILDPLAVPGSYRGVPRQFELLLSDDGQEYRVALSGELQPLPIEQSFVLPEPTAARYARLRVDSVWGDDPREVVLGEWKVIAEPGHAVGPEPLDIAAWPAGGHVAWMDPQLDSDQGSLMLTGDTSPRYVPAQPGQRLQWALGFEDDRIAQLTELRWTDPDGSSADDRATSVDLAVSLEGPIGPWVDIGTWDLARDADGAVAPFVFPEPAAARFLRFTTPPVGDDGSRVELPATIAAIERPTDASYRSILGQWGQDRPEGPQEWLVPPVMATQAAGPDGNDTLATAEPLVAGVPAIGRVHIDEDEDWYTFVVPATDNSVELVTTGVPIPSVRLTLVDAVGETVPMTYGPGTATGTSAGSEPGAMHWQAPVVGGATYTLRVDQPPFSAVVAFDNSGSMGPYLPFVAQALRSYSGGIVPGREAVQIVPFEESSLVSGWSDDRYRLQSAVANYTSTIGSSSIESGVADSAALLTERVGGRAILLITDAETTTLERNAQAWRTFAQARPRVFAMHVAGSETPVLDRHVMQDLAAAGGGAYQYARSHADIDHAFDRMATAMRRPADYTLAMETSEQVLPPQPPGTLRVLSPLGPDGAPGPVAVGGDVAIELVLDTSGSMLERFGGKRRIDVAKTVLESLVRDDLPPGVPVALRVFRQERASCETELAVPLTPLDQAAMAHTIAALGVQASVKTPLAAAIRKVADDLAAVTGPRIVIVVSDGQESCGGNPTKAVKALRAGGVDVTLNIVGMGLDKQARKAIAKLAKLGGGTYFDARDPGQLAQAIAAATSAPFVVYDEAGKQVARGTVNDDPLELPAGTYRVVVLTEPEATFDAVVVPPGQGLSLTLPGPLS